jgi:pyruvate formate lyase activating enzyme
VLLDIKAWDPARHRHLTGKEVGPTLEFAQRLAQRKRAVWLRFVLVPGVTSNEEDIAAIAKFVGSLGNVERVDVLPFHQMGRYKWKELGIDYALNEVEPPSPELIECACEQFRAVGLNTF